MVPDCLFGFFGFHIDIGDIKGSSGLETQRKLNHFPEITLIDKLTGVSEKPRPDTISRRRHHAERQRRRTSNNRTTHSHAHDREYEPRASTPANEDTGHRPIEWWEAIEMHPFRRNPIAPTAARLGPHRYIDEPDEPFPPNPRLPHHRGTSSSERRRSMQRQIWRDWREMHSQRPDLRREAAERSVEVEGRLRRAGFF